MHTAQQLQATAFQVEIDRIGSNLDGLFPDWNRNDRFGIVVNEPLGALGANLLLQAAITRYFDVRRVSHAHLPTYPEIYLFHVGGPHGDHSMYDIQHRKEIRVGTDPWELIVAIAERGITRLAVPDGEPAAFEYLHHPGGWFYSTAVLDHVQSAFAYAANGRVAHHDVVLHTEDNSLLYNRQACLDLEGVIGNLETTTAEALARLQLGYTSMDDLRDYTHQLRVRAHEVPLETRRELAKQYDGLVTEHYRRIDGDQMLRLLKRSGEVVSGEFAGVAPAFPYRQWQP